MNYNPLTAEVGLMYLCWNLKSNRAGFLRLLIIEKYPFGILKQLYDLAESAFAPSANHLVGMQSFKTN
jgi:hypothetical protein